MKNQIIHLVKFIFFIPIVLFSLTSNVLAKTDITDQIIIERIPYKGSAYIKNVKVYQDGDELIVRGQLKQNRSSARQFNGHVDISIIAPDGRNLNSTSIYHSPRFRSKRSLRKLSRKTTFMAKFSEKIIEGTTIKVALHKKEYELLEKGFHCGNNVAQTK